MADFVVGNLVWKVTGDTSLFDKNILSSTKKIEKFEAQSKKVGSTLTKTVSLPLIGVGAVAIKTAAAFERQEVSFHSVGTQAGIQEFSTHIA